MAVSCSADRQALGKITGTACSSNSSRPTRRASCPRSRDDHLDDTDVVHIDLNRPMADIRAELSKYPVKTRVMLTGPMVVARDIAHAKIKERLDAGEPMPQYLHDYCVYYAGPAKTPEGYASGSFGPTTAGRMDSYVDQFQAAGGSIVMLAKGNRSKQVTDACKAHGGFYLGSIGGPAARLALDSITKVDVLEYPELGMEAVWKIEVDDFPAFIVVDDKGNDFFDLVRREAQRPTSGRALTGRHPRRRRTGSAHGTFEHRADRRRRRSSAGVERSRGQLAAAIAPSCGGGSSSAVSGPVDGSSRASRMRCTKSGETLAYTRRAPLKRSSSSSTCMRSSRPSSSTTVTVPGRTASRNHATHSSGRPRSTILARIAPRWRPPRRRPTSPPGRRGSARTSPPTSRRTAPTFPVADRPSHGRGSCRRPS